MSPRRIAIASTLALAGLAVIPAAGMAAPKVVNACMITTNAKCPGAKLQGQDLAGANMSRANLKGANLKGADLRKAKFAGANLQGANFTGADIRGADFSNARLQRAKFIRVRAWTGKAPSALGANCNASLQNTGGSYVNAQLQNATLSGNYSYWNFGQAKMSGTQAPGVNFSCTTFTSVNANSYAYVNQATCVNPAEKTNFSKASFAGADMSNTALAGWSFTQVKTQTLCSGGSYTPALSYYPDFSGVNFQNTTLTNVTFWKAKVPSTTSSLVSGTVWNNTTCPQANVTTGSPCTPTSP